MSSEKNTQRSGFEARKQAIERADEELLETLGYKQEFKRAFKPIEVSTDSFVCERGDGLG